MTDLYSVQVVDWLALGTGELVLQRMNGYQV
jgi:hypothetical protein